MGSTTSGASAGRVYLDYAATAPLCAAARHALEEFLQAPDGGDTSFIDANANSLHSDGRAAFKRLEADRSLVARCLGARPDEFIFTSGATESNNAALFGIVHALREKLRVDKVGVLTSTIEHDAVYQTAQALQRLGIAEVSFVKPTRSGHIRAEDVHDALQPNTAFVSLMAANNEIGAVNDLQSIGKVVHDAGALFHTDMVQLLGKTSIDLHALPIDAASFSAHKIGGAKGVGALYIKAGTPFYPFLAGGGQEGGRRSGTQNVGGIAGFAAACASCTSAEYIATTQARLQDLRDKLYADLCTLEQVHASVPCEAGSTEYLPNIVNVCVDGWESETLILQLDLAGFSVSGGSACSSHALEPSRVLTEIGIGRDRALGSLRISLGPYTTAEHISSFMQAFSRIVNTQGKKE